MGVNDLNQVRIKKILLILSSIFLTLAILSSHTQNQLNDFIISIYDYLPLFWLFISISIGIAIMTLIYGTKTKVLFVAAFFIVSICIISILLIPYITGMNYFGSSDSLLHLGVINNIIDTGHIVDQDPAAFYPMLHIFSTEICFLLGTNPQLVPYYFYIAEFVLYIAPFVAISRLICNNNKQVGFLVSMGLLTFLIRESLAFTPFTFALEFIPFLIYLSLKKFSGTDSDPRISMSLIILIILMPLIHPLGGIFSLIILASFLIANRIMRPFSKPSGHFSLLLSIGGIMLLAWAFNFNVIKVWTNEIVSNLVMQQGSAPLTSYQISIFNSTLYEIVTGIFFIYGAFIILTSLAFFLFVNEVIKKRKSLKTINPILFPLFISIVLLGMLTAIFIFEDLLLGPRTISLLAIQSAIVLSILIYKIRPNSIVKEIAPVFLLMILLISLVFGFFPSPLTYTENWQITEKEEIGTNWVFSQTSENSNIVSMEHMEKFSMFLGYGQQIYSYPIPSHLNFSGSNLTGNTIMILNNRTEELYTGIYPTDTSKWLLSPSDLAGIKWSENYSSIYYNGDSSIWDVKTGNQ